MPVEETQDGSKPWLSRIPSWENARRSAQRMDELGIRVLESGTLTREAARIVESPRFREQLEALKKLRRAGE